MRIALNAQLLSLAENYRSGGISRVIYHLLAELGRDARGHSYDVFAPAMPSGFPTDSINKGHLRLHPTGEHTLRPALRIAWEQTILPRRLEKFDPDHLHDMAYPLPV